MPTSFNLIRCSRIAAAVVCAFVTTTVAIVPVSPVSADAKLQRQSTLTGDHTKQKFLVGERIDVKNANVADDVFAAGQHLEFEASTAKNIIAAGMTLSMNGVNADELILAAGEIKLSGSVKDDIIAATCAFCPMGGRLHLKSDLQVGDDTRLVGREVIVDGRIGGTLKAMAQSFKLTGEVTGDARIEAKDIEFAPGARIGGDLLYASKSKPQIPEGIVQGEIRQVDAIFPFD